MPGNRLYVGNIPHRARERDLERFFRGYGRIRDIVVKDGYGFVEFDDSRDADDAVHDLDGRTFQGERVRVEMARARDRGGDRGGGGGGRRGTAPGPRTNYRLIVENLSSKTSWQDLKDYFRVAGDITYTNVNQPREGEGIVEFADRRGLEYALDHRDDLELDGRRLRVHEENRGGSSRRSRSRSRSRSPRSRSRSRSRSKSRSRSRSSRSRSRSSGRSGSRSRSRSHSRGR